MTENAASGDRRESSGCGDPFAESNGDSAIGRERANRRILRAQTNVVFLYQTVAVFRYGTAIHDAFIAIGLKSVITGDEIGRDRYVKAQPLLVTILRHHTDVVLPQFVRPQPRDIHAAQLHG